MHPVETLARDLRYALRTLRNSPGFAIIAILTLALGIGANTAIFSVLQGVVLAPLPFHQPERLLAILQENLTLKRLLSVSYPDWQDWRRNAGAFEQMAAIRWNESNLTSPGPPRHVNIRQISSAFFSTLGTPLTLGREFTSQEAQPGGPPSAIISHRFWQDQFKGDPDALGKTVTLDGRSYTIIGVAPLDFHFGEPDAALYTPLAQDSPLRVSDRTIHAGIICVARLKPGETQAQARAAMSVVQTRLTRLYPAADRGVGTNVMPLKDVMVLDVSQTLLLLFGAVALVLLIACANVASLLLARSVVRSREFAIRLALGAGRARIVWQLISEGALLSLTGGFLGLLAAAWAIRPALSLIGGNLPRGQNIGISMPVLLFTFGISIAVGVLFGLAPALKSSKADLQLPLKQGARGHSGGHHRAQGALVIAQMALTLVLLTGATLLLRTIHNLWQVNPGFDFQHVITFKVGLSPAKTASATRGAYRQLIDRIRRLPGIQAVDLTAMVPLAQQSNAGPFWVGSQPPAYVSEAPRAQFYWTGPDYRQTMQIPLLRGRYFTQDDTAQSAPVIVIDSVLARTYFPDKDPVGQLVNIPHWGVVRVVGVVEHVRQSSLGDPNPYTQNQIYAALNQLRDEWVPIFYDDATVAVRTPLDLAAVLPEIKSVVYGAAGEESVYQVQTMCDIAAASLAPQRFPMILLVAFAALALLLASVGIYGVISYSVTGRVLEMAIRIALGAKPSQVFRLVIGYGLRLAAAGIVMGAVSLLILTHVLRSFSHLLYGVRAYDPLTFLATSFVLTAVAFVACCVPACRATRIDPIAALHCE